MPFNETLYSASCFLDDHNPYLLQYLSWITWITLMEDGKSLQQKDDAFVAPLELPTADLSVHIFCQTEVSTINVIPSSSEETDEMCARRASHVLTGVRCYGLTPLGFRLAHTSVCAPRIWAESLMKAREVETPSPHARFPIYWPLSIMLSNRQSMRFLKVVSNTKATHFSESRALNNL